MRCRPQCRQRLIWAYQPGPSSSKPSCGVSPSQSGQKRRNRSGRSHKRISLRQARADTDDQSPSTAYKRCQKLRPVPLPRRPLLEATPPRPRVLRRVKGGAERAIISFSYKPPIFRASNVPAEGVRVARPRSPYTHVLRDSAQDYEAAAEPTDSGITVAEHAGCVFSARCRHKFGPLCGSTSPPFRGLSATHAIACRLDTLPIRGIGRLRVPGSGLGDDLTLLCHHPRTHELSCPGRDPSSIASALTPLAERAERLPPTHRKFPIWISIALRCTNAGRGASANVRNGSAGGNLELSIFFPVSLP